MALNKKVLAVYIILGTCILSFLSLYLSGSFHKSVSDGKDLAADKQTAVQKNPKSKKVIGVSVMNYKNEYWLDFIDGIKAFCRDNAIEVNPVNVNDNIDEQVKSIEKFVVEDVDGIILAPINDTALEPIVHKSMSAGIKIITHHYLKEFNVFHFPNEYDIGFMAGRQMGKLLKEKDIKEPKLAMLKYPELGTLIDREKGIEDGLREYVPNTTIIAKRKGPDRELGEAAAADILKDYPDINGFVGINDNGLIGALKAADRTGASKREDFLIVGIGGDAPTLELIKRGTAFKATVYIDPWMNGYNDARFMKEMFEGRDYHNKVVYLSPLEVIDSSNVDRIILEKDARKKLSDANLR